MELKFERRVINLNVYGDNFEVMFPTQGQLDKYLADVKLVESGELKENENELMLSMIAELGLPKEKAKKMEIGHLTELTNVLLDAKKN